MNEVFERMKFSPDIQNLLDTKWKDVDIYSMSKDELIQFKKEVQVFRDEYNMLELGTKVLMNAAYGACGNEFFYFYNVNLAGDITGECRETTKMMNAKLEKFFHEDIWERTDLQDKFNFRLDESKHEWMRTQKIWRYSDTDSSYISYASLFECFTDEYKPTIETDMQKTQWILKFNTEFLDKQNFKWLSDYFNPRHGHNIHNFELETISKTCIYLKKKKYLKKIVFNKGKFLVDHPKVSGTGIELIKSTTPSLCRSILKELTRILMDEYINYNDKTEFILYFNSVLNKFKNQFYESDYESISQSVSIGAYNKYVKNDMTGLEFEKKAPISVKAIARYNYMAHLNDADDKKVFSGKIKYYRIKVSGETEMFGFPSGEIYDWYPRMDKQEQWNKTVIDPINRFLEVMEIPLVSASGAVQLTLF